VRKFSTLTVRTYPIPPFGWPEASLYRYRLIMEYQEFFVEDLLVHLDADMKVFSNFVNELPDVLRNGIGLVRHPGYYRPQGVRLLRYYLKHPKRLVTDYRTRILKGGIGSWESNPKYLAFVPRRMRKHYVCGGTWLGWHDEFLRMVSNLAKIEIDDSKKGLTPIWHDESILNKWSSENETTLLGPSFCFEPTYPQLEGLTEYIRAVDKGEV